MFQSQIGLHRAFEPWKRVDSHSFFFDGSTCLREIFSNTPLYSSDTRGGQKKWVLEFLFQIDTVPLVFYLVWIFKASCLNTCFLIIIFFTDINFSKHHSDIDVLMNSFALVCLLLMDSDLLSLDDEKHIHFFGLWSILWLKCVNPGWQKWNLILLL